MRKFLKITAIILSLMLSIMSFAGCDSSLNNDDYTKEAPSNASNYSIPLESNVSKPKYAVMDIELFKNNEEYDNYMINRGSGLFSEVYTIKNIIFLDSLSSAPNNAWDYSLKKDKSVLAWVHNNETLYVAGNGGVSVEDSSFMFSNFNFLWSIEKIDLTNLDTSCVKNMRAMFHFLNDLKTIEFGNFDTSNATDMYFMFQGCSSLKSLDLSSFDTSKVEGMFQMFEGCESLETIDLSSFNTSKVKSFGYMFENCTSLRNLDISHFDMINADTTDMFKGTKFE